MIGIIAFAVALWYWGTPNVALIVGITVGFAFRFILNSFEMPDDDVLIEEYKELADKKVTR